MISDTMETELNEQINKELFSSYLYLSMSAYFESTNLAGFASWMAVQAQEELIHAMKIYGFVNERGGKVSLGAIEEPKKDWKSPLDAFENAYEHELMISASINSLVDKAIEEKDHASNNFLQWYVKEQVEEEASADEIVQKLKMSKQVPEAIYMLDKELGLRPEAIPIKAAILGTKGG